jgi:hypothetical protein
MSTVVFYMTPDVLTHVLVEYTFLNANHFPLAYFEKAIADELFVPVVELSTDMQEAAFEYTQNFSPEGWQHDARANHRAIRTFRPDFRRSSMSGDIFLTPEGAFVCLGVGWYKLPDHLHAKLEAQAAA